MPNKYNVRAKRLALDNLIRDRAWNAFQIKFPISDADDAKHKSDANLSQTVVLCRNHQTTHRTLLHSLCDVPSDSSPPPPDVIRLVATACPRSLLLHESGTERTPLHLALIRGASLDTIKALMEAVDHDKSLNKRDILLALDSKGHTPLLSAVKRGAPDDVVKYLVGQDVDGSSLLISGRSKKKQQQAGVPLKYVASNESILVGEGLDNPQDLLRFMLVMTYRSRWKRIFPSFYNNPSDSGERIRGDTDQTNPTVNDVGEICILQAAICCYDLLGPSKLASSILSYVIRNNLFHRDRLGTRRDDAGNLTLHIACLADTNTFEQVLKLGERISDYGLNSDDCTLIEYLANSSPSSTYLSKNYAGEIPLHCAIKTGKDWSLIQPLLHACPCSVQMCTNKGELPLHLAIKCGSPIPGIMKLWDYFPDAASFRDESNGLYPFQLAAVSAHTRQSGRGKSKRKKSSIEGGNGWDWTSLSFFLLRECPSLLSSSLLS